MQTSVTLMQMTISHENTFRYVKMNLVFIVASKEKKRRKTKRFWKLVIWFKVKNRFIRRFHKQYWSK